MRTLNKSLSVEEQFIQAFKNKNYECSQNFHSEYSTNKIKQILEEEYNSPHLSYNTIHIAGTSGKGSITHYSSKILHDLGYKVGTYSSPHYSSIYERIQVNTTPITESTFLDLWKQLESTIEKYNLSYFEVLTLITFIYFEKEKVEYGVIEVGIGGLKDATNIIQPKIVIFTSIHIDHCQVLGYSQKKILTDKVGIIKKSASVYSISKDKVVNDFLKKEAKKKKVPFQTYSTNIDGNFLKENLLKTIFILKDFFQSHPSKKNLRSKLQKLEELQKKLASDIYFKNNYLYLKGRFEIFTLSRLKTSREVKLPTLHTQFQKQTPYIIFDAAHNKIAFKTLFQTWSHQLVLYKKKEEDLAESHWIIFFSLKKNKNFVRLFYSILHNFYLYQPSKQYIKEVILIYENKGMLYSKKQFLKHKKILNQISSKFSIKYRYSTINQIKKNIKKNKNNPQLACGSIYLYQPIKKAIQTL